MLAAAQPAAIRVDRAITTHAPEPPKLGMILLSVYVFLLFSRIQDFAAFLHVPMILVALSIVYAVLSGGLTRPFTSPIGMCLIGLTIWMALSIPLSVWPGGSATMFVTKWLRALLGFFLTTALIYTPRQIRSVLTAIACGAIVGALTAIFTGGDAARMAVDNTSRLSDANDFAQFLLVAGCLVFAVITRPGVNRGFKLLLYCGLAILFFSFIRTGSRGGLIGLMAVLVAFLITSRGRKMKMLFVLGAAILVLSIAFLPETLRMRYLYVLGDKQATTTMQDEAGAASAEARTFLFWESVRLTFTHPIFGVGPGMFQVAENDLAKKEGYSRGSWHETHNAYTQVSSETGLLGAAFFLGALFLSYRAVHRVVKLSQVNQSPDIVEASRLAYWFRLSFIGFLATSVFLSVSYTEELEVFIGIAAVFEKWLRTQSLRQAAQTMPRSLVIGSRLPQPL